jgi:hypothetical protein
MGAPALEANMKPPDPVIVIAGITIAAFAIDRLVTGGLFLLSATGIGPKWADPEDVGKNERRDAEKKYKVAYYTAAGILALAVYVFGNLSVFGALGIQGSKLLDAMVTILVIVGGTDRVASLLKGSGSDDEPKESDKPVQISGSVMLVPPSDLDTADGNGNKGEVVMSVKRP